MSDIRESARLAVEAWTAFGRTEHADIGSDAWNRLCAAMNSLERVMGNAMLWAGDEQGKDGE